MRYPGIITLVLILLVGPGDRPRAQNLTNAEDSTLATRHFILPTITVTASGRETANFHTARFVTAVSADDVRERGIQTTPDALSEEPGVWVQKTCLGGGSPFIRGLTGKHVLLLVDGIRLNNSTYRFGPSQYLNTVDPAVIERLEVVRGPGSTLYGSDALGGVVNIITRRSHSLGESQPEPARLHVSQLLSSADRGSISNIDLQGGGHRFGYTVGASYRSFGNLRAGSGRSPVGAVDVDDRQSPTSYDASAADASLQCIISPSSRATAFYSYSHQRDVPRSDKLVQNDYQDTPEDAYYYDPQDLEFGYLGFESRGLLATRIGLSYNRQLEGRRRRKSGWTKNRFERDEIKTLGLVATATRGVGRAHYISAGIDLYHDDIASSRHDVSDDGATSMRSPRYPDGTSYQSGGAFVQADLRASRILDFGLGVRLSAFDLDTDFDGLTVTGSERTVGPLDRVRKSYSDVTWSVSGVFHAVENLNIYGSIARGFRAPNVDDIAVDGEWSSGNDIPNPDVRPEYSVNHEIGVKYLSQQAEAGASFSRADYSDLIVRRWFDSGPDSVQGTTDDLFQFRNAAKAEIHSIECWGRYVVGTAMIGRASFFANLAWTYGENITDREPIDRIPPLQGVAGLRFESVNGQQWGELFIRAADDQSRLSDRDKHDVRIPKNGTPGWTTLNVRGGCPMTPYANLVLACYNITDLRYRVHGSGIDAPGINFVAGLDAQF